MTNRFSINSPRFAMLKNVQGCVTSSGTVASTSATLLPTGRTLEGQRAPVCSATPTAGTWTPTWSTGETGRCLNTREKVVFAEVEAAPVRELYVYRKSGSIFLHHLMPQRLKCLLQPDFFSALSVAGEYTVNGARCLRGGCRLNPDVNYW